MSAEIVAIAREASHFLRRELEKAGVANVLTPRLVNPRSQGWVRGFVLGLGDALSLDDASRYTLEATVYVTLFEGTPMGEQLGLEALMMARHGSQLPMPGWDENLALGKACGESFARFNTLASTFGDSLR